MNETIEYSSSTYKLKAEQVTDDAIYFTIVEDKLFFINCKDMKSFQWITALMTAYSRQIADGKDISSIIDDMKETFQPGGNYILTDGTGRKVNSLIHHLGLILEQHIGDAK